MGVFQWRAMNIFVARVVRALERKDLWLAVDGKGSAESFLKCASLSHCRYLFLKDLPNANTAQQIATITLGFYTQEHEVQLKREEGDISRTPSPHAGPAQWTVTFILANSILQPPGFQIER